MPHSTRVKGAKKKATMGKTSISVYFVARTTASMRRKHGIYEGLDVGPDITDKSWRKNANDRVIHINGFLTLFGLQSDRCSSSSSSMNRKGMTTPLRGISPMVVMPTQALLLFPTYSSGSIGTNMVDPYAPENMIQDSIILVANLIIIAYILDMVSHRTLKC